jgi:eukaryotic-like serine/threonine-protein kinase
MPLTPGIVLGPYEILAPLGAGGMGEVYRARDTRLGREVALKILPAEMADDASRRQRFEQEARAVAALNHPNIVAIHDVGDGYIITELVDGESLRGAKFGLRKALDIAVQIANGLAAAHAAGIVHRDLKPENILLTRDGRVKILDFGLAKAASQGHAGAATQTMAVHTEPGTVMGTVGYMSPEQIRGATVDHRSDIFSFGVLLYELFSGNRAFQADTSVETMTAILKQDPPELAETVPAGVRQIVMHCLEKDPANRFQSARDLAFALGNVSQSGSHAAPVTGRARRRIPWAPLAAAAGIVMGAFGVLWLRHAPQAPVWSGVMLGGPERATIPRPSPDGHLVAFHAPDAEDFDQIWVMKPESGNRALLTHNRDRGWISSLSWSPDGSRIYFDRQGDSPKGVYSVPVLGGEEQLVLEAAGNPEALPDGSLLLTRLNADHLYQAYRYWPDSGKLQPYPVELVFSSGALRPFPGGRQAVLVGAQLGPGAQPGRRLYSLDLETGNLRALSVVLDEQNNGSFAAVPSRDGKSVYFSSHQGNVTQVSAVPLDRSPAKPLLTLTGDVFSLDTGADGSLYLDQVDRPMGLVRFSPKGGALERLAAISGAAAIDNIAVLPDGRAVWAENAAGRVRIMLAQAGKEPVPLVNTVEDTVGPMTPAGPGEIAFLIGPIPRRTIALASVSTGRITHRLVFDKGRIDGMAAAPDGTVVYCVAAGVVWAVPVSGGAPRKIRAGDWVAVESPGDSLIVASLEHPRIRLFRVPQHGGRESEIALAGPYLPASPGATPGAVRNGLLVMSVASPLWYNPPGIFDLATGKSQRIPLDYTGDFWRMSWTPDGKIVAETMGWISTLWKFTQ